MSLSTHTHYFTGFYWIEGVDFEIQDIYGNTALLFVIESISLPFVGKIEAAKKYAGILTCFCGRGYVQINLSVYSEMK